MDAHMTIDDELVPTIRKLDEATVNKIGKTFIH